MNSTQLSCFLAVAETLSFAKAAERLNITQPAVTQQIRSLEDELNVRLFNRTTRSVSLTHAGIIFIRDARIILDVFERARQRFSEPAPDIRLPFVLGLRSRHETELITEALSRLREQYPNIYPIFEVIHFKHIQRRILEDDIDAIISFLDEDVKKPASYTELTKISIKALVPPSDPLSEKEVLTIEDLGARRLILTDPRDCSESYAMLQRRFWSDRLSSDIYLTNSMDGAATLAKAGFGIAVMADICVNKDPGLRYIPITDTPELSYGIYYRKPVARPELKSFIRIAVESIRSSDKNCPS